MMRCQRETSYADICRPHADSAELLRDELFQFQFSVMSIIFNAVQCQVVLDKSEFGGLQFIAKHQNSELFIVAMIVIESVRVNNLRSLLKY